MSTSRRRRAPRAFLLLVAGLGGAFAAPVRGPEPVVEAPTVVVRAPIADTPESTTVLPLAIAEPGAPGLAAISARTAGLHLGGNEARSFNDTLAIRGLVNTPIFGDPALTVYLDDLPLGSGFTNPSDLGGLVSARLHRGPQQATRFGRAGAGGVLELRTPEADTSARRTVTFGAGSDGRLRGGASLLTAAAARGDAYVTVSADQREGRVRNTVLGREIDDQDGRGFLARVRLRPSASAEIGVLVHGHRARDGAQPLVPLGGPLFSVSRRSEGFTATDTLNAAVRAAVDLPAGRLSWVSSRALWELGPYASVLAFGPAELLNTSELRQETYSQELRFVSGPSARLRWQGGLLFSDGDTDGAFARAFGPVVIERSTYGIGGRAGAVFAEAEWTPAPRLEFVAGLRAEGSRKTFARVEAAPTAQRFTDRRESSALLPKLSATYSATERTTGFAALSAGYKPGGFSAFTGRRDLAAFGPERLRAAEIGLRHHTPGRRLEATWRAYFYRIDGYQIERSFATPGPGDDYLVVNAPRAASLGGELEVRWRPTEGLELGLDAGVTRVTLRDFRDPYTGERFDGRRAPFVPSSEFAAVAEYRSRHGLFVGVGLARTGAVPFAESGDPRFVQAAVTLLDARIGLLRGDYRLTLSAANLTDERYYQSISAGTGHGTPGAPRSVGIDLSRTW